MNTVFLWAFLTGGITGGVWVAIVLVGRQRRLAERQAGLQEELERRLDQLERLDTRFEELADRLEFTERILAKERSAARIAPPETE